MPLLDSFTVDHTVWQPWLSALRNHETPHGDTITVFDLRFCRPNLEVMPERGIHTLEHLFAGFMRDHLEQPGRGDYRYLPDGLSYRFYMSLIGVSEEQRVPMPGSGNGRRAGSTEPAQNPGAERHQCGTYHMHSRWKKRRRSPSTSWITTWWLTTTT